MPFMHESQLSTAELAIDGIGSSTCSKTDVSPRPYWTAQFDGYYDVLSLILELKFDSTTVYGGKVDRCGKLNATRVTSDFQAGTVTGTIYCTSEPRKPDGNSITLDALFDDGADNGSLQLCNVDVKGAPRTRTVKVEIPGNVDKRCTNTVYNDTSLYVTCPHRPEGKSVSFESKIAFAINSRPTVRVFGIPSRNRYQFCTKQKDGVDYMGLQSYTSQGKTCLNWNSIDQPFVRPLDFPDVSTDHNFCRNPGQSQSKPWCFVGSKVTKDKHIEGVLNFRNNKLYYDHCTVPPCRKYFFFFYSVSLYLHKTRPMKVINMSASWRYKLSEPRMVPVCVVVVIFPPRDRGEVITDKGQQMEKWVEHYSELYSREKVVITSAFDAIKPLSTVVELDAEPTLEELSKAIDSLVCGKAPGMRDDKIVTLYKNKGDRSDCNNYRDISLLSILGKLNARVMLVRLQQLAERVYLESQCDFRAESSTVDMVSLRQLQGKSREQQKPLYVAFIDLTKAFDLVSRDGLFNILLKIGCPPKLHSMIRSFHDDMKTTIQYEGSISEPFNIKGGVTQGCGLAPTLFSLLLKHAFRILTEGVYLHTRAFGRLFNLARLRAKTKVRETLIRDTLFADDAAVTSHTNISSVVDRFSQACKDLRLSISLKKTIVLAKTWTPHQSSLLTTIRLDIVHQFTCLGTTIGDNLCLDVEINQRIRKAATMPGRLTTGVQRRLRWLSHVCRMEDGRIPKDILYGELASSKRSVGRPQLRYIDVCKHDLKALDINTESWEDIAANRSRWRCTLHRQLKAGEEQIQTLAEEKRARRKARACKANPATAHTCARCRRKCQS
ncbi:hypothetical protein ACOMHN_040772 [Nucella lapillus]